MFRIVRVPLLVLSLFGAMAAAAGTEIALDIGHSSARPGSVSARGRGEFWFNRDLAGQVSAALQAQQFEVKLINLDGSELSLEARAAKASGADLFVSLHHDSVQPRYLKQWLYKGEPQRYSDEFSGFSLFVSRGNPDAATSLICASAIGNALRATGFKPSQHHGAAIEGESRDAADAENGVYYYDELVVLRAAKQPAVLFEAGIIVNRDEEDMLVRVDMRERIARAVTRGLISCLRPEGKPRDKLAKDPRS